jgi:hypothetical protein
VRRSSTGCSSSKIPRAVEATNTLALIDSHGKVLARRTVGSNDWNHTWEYFEATLDLLPFSGKGTLKVETKGDHNGPFGDTEVPVRIVR